MKDKILASPSSVAASQRRVVRVAAVTREGKKIVVQNMKSRRLEMKRGDASVHERSTEGFDRQNVNTLPIGKLCNSISCLHTFALIYAM